MEMINKPRVFMIMPFSEDFMALFEELRNRFADKYEFTNAGDMDNQQSIIRSIIEGLEKADVVIADLTNRNANVFYELGLAHAMNKKVIIITQVIDELPFDIKAYRAFEYSMLFYKMPKLIEELTVRLDGAISGKMHYGSPVSDFATSSSVDSEKAKEDQREEENPQSGTSSTVPEIDTNDTDEKYFLDYLADYQESSAKAVESINGIAADIEEFNSAVTGANDELDRAKASSKKPDPSFVRNTARRLSVPIKTFADKLHIHTEELSNEWRVAEDSYLALLDDKHIQTPENIASVIASVQSLKSMQQAIDTSNQQVVGFENSLQGCMGLERQLNKSLSAVISEIEQYISITDSMKSSCERMISRSNIAIEKWESNNKQHAAAE